MKRLFVFLLPIILISLIFVSCSNDKTTETDVVSSESSTVVEGSGITDSSNISGETMSEDNSKTTPTIPETILYNPKPVAGGDDTYVTNHFREVNHHGFVDYLKNNEIADDDYFCIFFDTTYVDQSLAPDNLEDYLKEQGVIKNDDLTKIFFDLYNNDSPYFETSVMVGYITADIHKKLLEDDYAIEYFWLGETCLDGEHSECNE